MRAADSVAGGVPQQIVALGGQLKATFALGREGQAIHQPSPGRSGSFQRRIAAFERDIALYEKLFAIQPGMDRARPASGLRFDAICPRREAEEGIGLIAVQHHHAHLASCMAEHGLEGPVIGVCFDGTGYGLDGAVWGGEFLVGDYHRFGGRRTCAMCRCPAAEKAVREPWRMAMAHLIDAGVECPSLAARIDPAARRTVEQMIAKKFNSPTTSSAGRLFDAVAAIAGRARSGEF